MIINHAIQATDLLPTPRTTTVQMPAPARLPAPPAYPPARQSEDYDRGYLLEVAAAGMHRSRSFDLVGSRDHVEALCAELHAVHEELLTAQARLRALVSAQV